jgi:NAD(P)-dependent dehydrogenase (short-subunit alcohol dehydrogenase family)
MAAAPGPVSWQVCDVRDPAAVEAMIDKIWAERPLTALVNNAAGNFIAKTETLSSRAVDAVLGIVLHGSAYCTLACSKRWIAEERRGTVLSIVTSYAWMGSAYVVPSAMAKAGVLALTRSLAVEWGSRGIRLNGDDLAIDEAGAVGEEEGSEIRQFPMLARPAQRVAGLELARQIRPRHEPLPCARRRKRSGCNGVVMAANG